MNNFPKKGQKVYCKNCDTPLFEVKKEIQAGDEKMGQSTLEPIGEMESQVKSLQPVSCWKCGTEVNTNDMIIR